jgi:hypothetical protein
MPHSGKIALWADEKLQNALRAALGVLPDGSSLFLFGSITKETIYRDVDILILYDEKACDPKIAHRRHSKCIQTIAETSRAPVHISLLTYNEEESLNFIESVSAIRIMARGE